MLSMAEPTALIFLDLDFCGALFVCVSGMVIKITEWRGSGSALAGEDLVGGVCGEAW